MSAYSNPNSSSSTEKQLKITVEKNPSKSKLSELNINGWPKWACPPGKYNLKYEAEETCYMVRGKVKAYYTKLGSDFVEFGAGDLVTFPKGLRCTWLVTASVDKYYKFEADDSTSSQLQ